MQNFSINSKVCLKMFIEVHRLIAIFNTDIFNFFILHCLCITKFDKQNKVLLQWPMVLSTLRMDMILTLGKCVGNLAQID